MPSSRCMYSSRRLYLNRRSYLVELISSLWISDFMNYYRKTVLTCRWSSVKSQTRSTFIEDSSNWNAIQTVWTDKCRHKCTTAERTLRSRNSKQLTHYVGIDYIMNNEYLRNSMEYSIIVWDFSITLIIWSYFESTHLSSGKTQTVQRNLKRFEILITNILPGIILLQPT